MSKKVPNRILLTEEQMPKQWYNVRADMPTQHAPYINPRTMKPAAPEDLTPVFAEELCKQEVSLERYIDIPEEVLEYYKLYRPSPVIRAYQLERLLDTPARIYYKYEGSNTSGSHKLNSAVPQVYYNKKQGIARITTETGAGQWGTALAMACAYFDMPLRVYMVKVSYQQKPYRKDIMETYGANVFASPSDTTEIGRAILAKDPGNTGSLGTAISEAIEMAVSTPNTRYSLGSVLNQVLLHQSIIGMESKAQLEAVDEYPDYVIGSAGGGSNLGGLMSSFMQDRLTGKAKPYFIAVEPSACPSFTRGKFTYDFCDVGHITPLAKMYTLGSSFIPTSIHAGGLRYHGMSPVLSQLYHDGFLDEARAVGQKEVFDAAVLFAKHEAILPAPESAHAIKAAIDVALECKERGEAKTILFGLTGNGNFDLAAYADYNAGKLENYAPTDEDIAKSVADLNFEPQL
ncbi:MAG: TrpB-like pyridoxal phosphate-dependent enzyme [Clostridiales bacterium]|jgi:tryptophan synthase beta chain|nr:TrpB-like pyridoxal phosphate-dependent enzyme [Clostridiales bacterium]